MQEFMLVSLVVAAAAAAWLMRRSAGLAGHATTPRRPAFAAVSAEPQNDPLAALAGPLDTVALLLRLVSADGWADARDEAVAALRQVGNRRDVARAITKAERLAADAAEKDAVRTVDALTASLRRRMDRAELACITEMVSRVAYAGQNSAARASRAAALLLKG
ncbi:hypothetical protein ATO13_03495 [Stappia sp. 22II-S9-Z10]|nr:hypothetical protein ATO13_03495 [Stappia sp. 22II-S9-Z10]